MIRTFLFSAWPLFVGLFCIIVGNSIQGSLIAYRLGVENYSYLISGLILSAYYVGMCTSVFITPYFLRTVGHVRLFAAFTAIISATLLAFPLIVNPFAWLLLRFMIGFSYVGLFIITEAWVNALSTNNTRGQAMSLYMITQFLGYMTGQVLLGQSDSASPTLFLLASIGVSMAVVPMLMVRIQVPEQPDSDKIMGLAEIYSLSHFAFIGTIIVGMLSAVFYSSLGFILQKAGLSLAQLAVATTLMFLAALVAQWPIAKLSDNMDRRLVIVGLCFYIIGVCLYGFTIDTSSVFQIYSVVFLLSLAVMPMYSINIAHANDVTPSSRIVAMASSLQLFGASGAIAGPMLLTSFMGVAGFNGFFVFLIAGAGTLAAYALYRMRRRAVTVHSHMSMTPMTQLQSVQMDVGLTVDTEENITWDISKGETYQKQVRKSKRQKSQAKARKHMKKAVSRNKKKYARK